MDYYASGVLVAEVHGRLVANIQNYANDAGIQPVWITRRLADTCGESEVDWTRKFKFHTPNGRSGLVLVGPDPEPMPEDRMAAIAGALTRNFIRARVTTLNVLLATTSGGEAPDHTCLLVSNFYVPPAKVAKGSTSLTWKTQVLLDVLVARHMAGQQTVLYVSDLHEMTAAYGEALRQHLDAHYTQVQV